MGGGGGGVKRLSPEVQAIWGLGRPRPFEMMVTHQYGLGTLYDESTVWLCMVLCMMKAQSGYGTLYDEGTVWLWYPV
jgi:hypothetical protein